MGSKETKGVDRPYPLAEHLLAILDTVAPYVTLHGELKRYTIWTLEVRAQLEEIYGIDQALPTKRPATEWCEQDLCFARLSLRQDLLSSIFQEMEFEEILIKECPASAKLETCAELLVRVLEAWEQLPPLEKEKPPHGFTSILLTPPMQCLVLEIRNLSDRAKAEGDRTLRQVYDMRYTLLESIFEKWLSEILLEKTGQGLGGMTYLHFANWTVLIY